MQALNTAEVPGVVAIPELLHLIINEIDRGTLPTATRVCKQWSELTVPRIWQDLDSMMPVLELLGPLNLVREPGPFHGIWAFAGDLSTADWDRFAQYCRLIKTIRHSESNDWRGAPTSIIETTDLFLLALGVCHHANLQEFHWRTRGDGSSILATLPLVQKTVKKLSWNFDFVFSTANVPKIVKTISSLAGRRDVQLEEFSIDFWPPVNGMDRNILGLPIQQFLANQTSLRTLTMDFEDVEPFVPPSPTAGITRYAWMSTVQTIRIFTFVTGWLQFHPLLRLPSLRTVHLDNPLQDPSRQLPRLTPGEIYVMGNAWPHLEHLRIPCLSGRLELIPACAKAFSRLLSLKFQLDLEGSPPSEDQLRHRFKDLQTLHLGYPPNFVFHENAEDVASGKDLLDVVAAVCPDGTGVEVDEFMEDETSGGQIWEEFLELRRSRQSADAPPMEVDS